MVLEMKKTTANPTHNKSSFPCILLLIFLSVNLTPGHMNGTLEISPYMLSKLLD